jgi:DNA-binding MarR family transcriptional regulator
MGKMPHSNEVIKYIDEVIGSQPLEQPVEENSLKRLPFLISALYSIRLLSINDRRFILAEAKNSYSTPAQLAKHAELLQKAFNENVAFVFSSLPAYLRQRYVQKGIAFIVPETHLFMPFLAMDFRTKARKNVPISEDDGALLSIPSQVILLYHLQSKSLSGWTMGRLAKQFDYSVMTFSRAIKELVQKDLCTVERLGTGKILHFTLSGVALWEKALRYLQSPVKSVRFAHLIAPNTSGFIAAGISALSQYTMPADDSVATVAASNNHWRRALSAGKMSELPFPDEGGVKVELWKYTPDLSDKGSTAVDRLSLYLSLKDDSDERVQSALTELLKGVQWSKG